MEVKEKWTGRLTVNQEEKFIQYGEQKISFASIEDASYCYQTVFCLGKRTMSDQGEVLLCLTLDTPVPQPGKRLGFRKESGIVLRLETEEDARKVLDLLPMADCAHVWSEKDFPMSKCVVEAKKGCNDYIRGGTPGSRPYHKMGLVAPIIKPELDFAKGEVKIVYLGTNGYHQESQWFMAHPEDIYAFASSDTTEYTLIMKEGICCVNAKYQTYGIERDENAKGLWQIEMEAEFSNVCAGARWLKQLQDSENGRMNDEEIKEEIKEEISEKRFFDKEMLSAAVNLLHASGIISVNELNELNQRIEER